MSEQGPGLVMGGLGLRARHVALLLGLVFAVTLGVVVGKQMSREAMAVVIGIACGVCASVPTTALLWLVLSRRGQPAAEELQARRPGTYPPVVVIQGGAPQALPPALQAGYWPAPPPSPGLQRQFHIVGDDDLLTDGR